MTNFRRFVHVYIVVKISLLSIPSFLINLYYFLFVKVATARKEVQLAKEKLDSLISLYRKQLRMSKLEFISVSGTTHLIEVVILDDIPRNQNIDFTRWIILFDPTEKKIASGLSLFLFC